MKNFIYLVACTFFTLLSFSTSAQEVGIIKGKLIDQQSSEPIMFATLALYDQNKSLVKGTETDLDGNYLLSDIPVGTYSLEGRYVGYATITITDLAVTAGEVSLLDFTMSEESEVLEEVVVTAERVTNTEVALLVTRKASLSIDDALSEQALKRYGSSDVSSATKRIPGASVTDGKYISFRGLSDRYVVAMLNGQLLPSTDPYRNIPQLDLIPTQYLDNIVASKSFLPSMPGHATGGSLDIKTKSIPEQFTLSASLSMEYNTLSSMNDNFLTHEGGSTDWLGFDDGGRAYPAIFDTEFAAENLDPLLPIFATRDGELARLADEFYNALNTQKAPTTKRSGMNYGASLNFGNRFDVGEDEIGVLVGLSYSRKYSFYENGVNAYWQINGNTLDNQRDLRDTRASDNPQLTGFFNLAYKFGDKRHKISFNTLYNHDADKISRYIVGEYPSIFTSQYEGRALQFIERDVKSFQLNGEHSFTDNGLKLEWSGSFVKAYQDEPDFRNFDNSFILSDNGTETDTTYFVTASELPRPTHFYRRLDDEQRSAKFDLTIPFLTNLSKSNKIQLGAMITDKDRNFRDRVIQIYDTSPSEELYAGNPDAYFGSANGGIIDFNENTERYTIGLFPIPSERAALKNSYSGTEMVTAAYLMAVQEFGKLKFIGGARLEKTAISVASLDTTEQVGNIDALDLLPSVNLVYELTEKSNLRASFSQTLARPNMRELAPFPSFDFGGDFVLVGNPELERTKIKNFDLRWDFFPKPGELIAVSAYYKKFKDPIARSFTATAEREIRYINVDEADVYGVEVELRKNLSFISDALYDFNFITNVSLIKSIVDIPDDEQAVIDEFNPEKGTTRPFQGQSPFLFNAALNYSNEKHNLDAILAVNIFGERLSEISQGFNPDVYEQSRAQLDFSVRKNITKDLGIRLSANNLLNPEFKKTMSLNDKDYLVSNYKRGRTFKLSLSYQLN